MESAKVRLGRRRVWCLSTALLTIAAGLVWRLAPLGMPGAAVKFGGSALWAVMIYFLVAAARPSWVSVQTGISAGCISFAVEAFKLVYTPGLDAFRRTLAGKLLLGRVFGWWDLVVYGVAIAVATGVDRRLRNKARVFLG